MEEDGAAVGERPAVAGWAVNVVAMRTPSRMGIMTFSVRCTSYAGREARAAGSRGFISGAGVESATSLREPSRLPAWWDSQSTMLPWRIRSPRPSPRSTAA